MNISTGKTILDAAISFDHGLGKIDSVLVEIADEDERRAWRVRIGNVFRAVNEEIFMPIEKEFPELELR